MPKNNWLLWIAVPLCLLVGGAVGSALKSGDSPVGTPDVDAARRSDLEQTNERQRLELEAARLTIDTLRAELRGEGSPAGTGTVAMDDLPESAADEPGPEAESERVRLAKAALPGLVYHLSANPTDRDLLREYVNTAARAGEYDTAITTLEGLLARNPDSADIMAQLGRTYLMKTRVEPNFMEQGKLAFTALKRFDVALEKHPEHYDSRFLRAVTNYNMPPFMNKMDAVVKDFETLVSQSRSAGDDERAGDSFTWLVRAYQKAGRAEDAKGALRKGLELYPGNDGLEAMKQRLEEGE